MKNKKIKRLSIVMSLLLLFNSLGMFASDTATQDEVLSSSLTEEVASSSRNYLINQARMGKFYSDYSDAYFYANTVWYNSYGQPMYVEDDGLQMRSNCYGYAMRMFYYGENFPTLFGSYCYLQRIGEFAVKSNPIHLQLSPTESLSLSNYSDLDYLHYKFFGDNTYDLYDVSYKFDAFSTLLEADVAALGYTITEYTGDTIPDATTNRNQRMIAMIVGPEDYHFYMQHSDNTWSHKRGNYAPQNYCIEHDTPLTNDNIQTKAREGDAYEGGILKFYYITKNAIVDFKHRDGTAGNCTITRPSYTDLAGNHRYAAEDIIDFPDDYRMGAIDYPGDTDFYSVYTSYDETRTIWVETGSDYNLELRVYDSSGNLLASDRALSSASVTLHLNVDTLYYISISGINNSLYEENLTYIFG